MLYFWLLLVIIHPYFKRLGNVYYYFWFFLIVIQPYFLLLGKTGLLGREAQRAADKIWDHVEIALVLVLGAAIYGGLLWMEIV